MSHRLFEAVKRTSKQKGAARMLLLILADCQNDKTGICNPSVETLAQWCNTSVRNIRILIQGLVEDRELTVNKGGGRGNASSFTVNVLGVKKSEEDFTVSAPENSEEDFSEKEFTEKGNSEKSCTETVKDSVENSEKSCRVYKEEPKEPKRTVYSPVADAPDATPVLESGSVDVLADEVFGDEPAPIAEVKPEAVGVAPTAQEPAQETSGPVVKPKKASRKKSESKESPELAEYRKRLFDHHYFRLNKVVMDPATQNKIIRTFFQKGIPADDAIACYNNDLRIQSQTEERYRLKHGVSWVSVQKTIAEFLVSRAKTNVVQMPPREVKTEELQAWAAEKAAQDAEAERTRREEAARRAASPEQVRAILEAAKSQNREVA